MKHILLIAVFVLIFVGGTYGVWTLSGSKSDTSTFVETESPNGEFSASREGVGSKSAETTQGSTQVAEDFVVIARSGSASSAVVLVQPKQPTAAQPGLADRNPATVKQEIDALFNLQTSGSSASTATSPSVTMGKGIIVVSQYALYSWNDENSGGESLFSIDATSRKWKLLSMGGGVWSVDGLVTFGVPRATAEQLVAQKPWGQR